MQQHRVRNTIVDDPYQSASKGKTHYQCKVFDKDGNLKEIVPARKWCIPNEIKFEWNLIRKKSRDRKYKHG